MTVYNRNPGQVPEKERPAGDSLADRNPMALHKTMEHFTQLYGRLYTILWYTLHNPIADVAQPYGRFYTIIWQALQRSILTLALEENLWQAIT